jgi:hypothetical protein
MAGRIAIADSTQIEATASQGRSEIRLNVNGASPRLHLDWRSLLVQTPDLSSV